MPSFSFHRLLVLASAVSRLIWAASTNDWPGGAISGKVGELVDGSQGMSMNSGSSSSLPFQLPGYWGVSLPQSSSKRARWLPRDIDDDDDGNDGKGNFFLLEKRMPFDLQRRDSNVCRVGGDACGSGKWCYQGIGCCGNNQMGCNGMSCCPGGSVCCPGGLCCPKGYVCVTINGRRGCCRNGARCVANGGTVDTEEGRPDTSKGSQCSDRGFGLCPSGEFCCPAGKMCLRDPQGNPSCEVGCAKTGWSVCPNNNFCCPPNAQCYVDENGNNRCRVIVTTTVFVSAQPTSTASNDDDGGDDDDQTFTDSFEPTATESGGAASTSSSTTRSFKSTRTISRDKTITVTPTGNSDNKSPQASAKASPAAPAANSSPPKVHNGGLDDIFTNSANRQLGPSIFELIIWVVGSVFLSGWFFSR